MTKPKKNEMQKPIKFFDLETRTKYELDEELRGRHTQLIDMGGEFRPVEYVWKLYNLYFENNNDFLYGDGKLKRLTDLSDVLGPASLEMNKGLSFTNERIINLNEISRQNGSTNYSHAFSTDAEKKGLILHPPLTEPLFAEIDRKVIELVGKYTHLK
ncbi:MAG: hypothetical protein WC758_05660 [Candidatus Woesearchaeota archaeon]|jgi:hypothetical protein